MELLRCEKDLVEAAVELGTTSAEDDLLTTDAEVDDEEDGRSPARVHFEVLRAHFLICCTLLAYTSIYISYI